MAQDVNYIRQHGVDGVPRSPALESMHFYSRFYDRSERVGAGDVVEKSDFAVKEFFHSGLERVKVLSVGSGPIPARVFPSARCDSVRLACVSSDYNMQSVLDLLKSMGKPFSFSRPS